jgi:hypothetical protein
MMPPSRSICCVPTVPLLHVKSMFASGCGLWFVYGLWKDVILQDKS